MKTLTVIISGLALLAIAGCGSSGSGSGDNDNGPDPQPAGLLSPVTDLAAFEASIKSGLTMMSSDEQLALAGTAEDANFTGTYTQELNVDELDVVRYDGNHLFVAPRRYFRCCFILGGAAEPVDDPKPVERSVRILATDPGNGSAGLVSEIPLEDDVSVQGMYVDGGRMFALIGQMDYGRYGPLWADYAIWAPEKLGFRVYDVSDAGNPTLEVDASIDGVFVESRRIGNTVYVVSRYTPWIEGLDYYVSTAAQQTRNEGLLANVRLDDLLPKITVAGETRTLVEEERFYVTTGDESSVHPVIKTVTAIPIDDPTNLVST